MYPHKGVGILYPTDLKKVITWVNLPIGSSHSHGQAKKNTETARHNKSADSIINLPQGRLLFRNVLLRHELIKTQTTTVGTKRAAVGLVHSARPKVTPKS